MYYLHTIHDNCAAVFVYLICNLYGNISFTREDYVVYCTSAQIFN